MGGRCTTGETFTRAVRRQSPPVLPVAFCISTQYICARYGVRVKDYLYDAETKLRVQCTFQDDYPEALLVPGIYPDFGCGVVEPSAFGCRLVGRENNPLCPEPVCPQPFGPQPGNGGLEAVDRLKMPDPEKDGLLPQVLEQYRYYRDNLDMKYRDEYGYLDGFAFCMGPVETAALVAGYENFLIGMHDCPERIHRLLNMTTDFTLMWLRTQEKINGGLKRIYLFDHTPARVGPDHFEEFVFSPLRTVCSAYPDALKIFHICERNILHVLGRLGDIGIDVLYFAADLEEVKGALGDRVSLMGNISNVLLMNGNPEQVADACGRCIEAGADREGGFVLAPSGAFFPGTPEENIRRLIEAPNDNSKK